VSDLLTVAEVASRLGVSPLTVRSWILSRKIPFRKIGPVRAGSERDTRPVRIAADVLAEFVQEVPAL
jgi:excisionase family DNA binding protein